jgi:hypothetical protein
MTTKKSPILINSNIKVTWPMTKGAFAMTLHHLSLHVSSVIIFPLHLIFSCWHFNKTTKFWQGQFLGKEESDLYKWSWTPAEIFKISCNGLYFHKKKVFQIRNVKTSKVGIKHQSINLYLTWPVNVTCGFIFLYTPVTEYSRGLSEWF